MTDHLRYAIIVPFRDNAAQAEACAQPLLEQVGDSGRVVLVDDGSAVPATFDDIPGGERLVVLRNEASLGAGGARNRALAWCRERGVEIVMLLDSDCLPGDDFVRIHMELHEQEPDVVCAGGAVEGIGKGPWAALDRVASWFTSLPGDRPREVGGICHIPTTNMSFKLGRIPQGDPVFDASLRTGEDVKFVRELRVAGCRVRFCAMPVVRHHDREQFGTFFRHQYRWGLHTYAMRFGGGGSLVFRCLVAAGFILLLPFFALASAVINIVPWMRRAPVYILYFLPLVLLYLCKGAAVIHGIIIPQSARIPNVVSGVR